VKNLNNVVSANPLHWLTPHYWDFSLPTLFPM